ncbi:hypothetical protein [Streptococcus suis]|uniref:hypothetical protein n=1 Tax=Streptococcus suis TaxID=1307 RepID=UPI0011560EAA|nr:hypothetical protein [Streptococcus suis]
MAFDDNYSICQQSIKNVLKNVLKNALGMLKTSGQGLFLSAKTAIFKNVRDKSKCFAIENQKNAIFLIFGQQKSPADRWVKIK